MVIKTPSQSGTKFRYSRKPCKRCGTLKRYKSNGMCVECRRVYDAAREDDRRSHRKKCEDALRKNGVRLPESREERDNLIAQEYPFMGLYLAGLEDKNETDEQAETG